LLTRIDTVPSFPSASANIAATAAESATSACSKTARPPAATISARNASASVERAT
jgi:hypothetical protein